MVASGELAQQKRELEDFLFERVYRHPNVVRHRQVAQQELHQMFELLLARPELLPAHFLARSGAAGVPRCVADYLAGMTDRFAQREYERLSAL